MRKTVASPRTTPRAAAALATSAIACALASAGCPRPSRPVVNATPPAEIVPCALRGVQRLYPSAYLTSAREGGAAIAKFDGSYFQIVTADLNGAWSGRAQVTVRAPAAGPAFVVRGFLDERELELRATRDLPIVAPYIYLSRGAPIVLVPGGSGGRPRVIALYGDFSELSTIASCDGIAFGERDEMDVRRAPILPSENRASLPLMHIAHAHAILRDEEGRPLIDLVTGDGATVEVGSHKGDLIGVRYDDGVRLDGFLRAADLADGAGPDCDDCHGSVRDLYDKCPDEPGDDDVDGCPGVSTVLPATAVRDADIHLAPRADGEIVGTVERRAEVIVLGDRGRAEPASATWARVLPRRTQIEPGEHPFWVEKSALAIP